MVPRSDVSAQRRTEILDAAMVRFLREGYTNTTMDDVVAECGLSKGTIYWYFEGKDDLFNSVVARFFGDFAQETMTSLAGCETAAEQFRCGGRALARFCQQAEGLFGLFLEYWSQSGRRREASQVWVGMLQQYAGLIAGLVEEGERQGEFKPVDGQSLAWAILAAYDGLAVYAMMKPDLDLGQVSETFIETLLRGLRVG
ncbi:MAG: TetR/AcrR family transcriptional regulator [Anaerolineae bacterium]|jgi:AcrR family transcriptional regulator